MVVVSQTSEVIEDYHLQVWPGESIRQFLADGVEDAQPRLLLDALGKCFFLALGLLLRRRLVAGHVIVDGALLRLAEVEDCSSTLAVDEDSGLRVGAFPFSFD